MADKTTKLGKYTLGEQLGSGTFGWVYKATDPVGRTVAVKILKPGWADDPMTLERFQREAQVAGELFHNRIATIIDFDEYKGRRFLVMRYIDGVSLDTLIKEKGCLPWAETLEILTQVAEGLDYAHLRGIVHRDIKPANILVSGKDGAVLTDFGLARAAAMSGMSSGSVIVGTPHYIAPEIWNDEPASSASDLYSLACVTAEMLTGEVLFAGSSVLKVMKQHEQAAPPLPGHWPEGVPDGLNAVLAHALQKDPAQRGQTVTGFVSDLKELTSTRQRQAEAVEMARETEQAHNERSRITAPSQKSSTFGYWLAGMAALVFIGLGVLAAVFVSFQIADRPVQVKPVPTAAGGANATVQLNFAPPAETKPPVPTPSLAPTNTLVPNPNLGIGSTLMREKDGMRLVFVPQGSFTMGSESGEQNERPAHTVDVAAFWIDQTEVTNAMYAKCVLVENCQAPTKISAATYTSYFGNPEYADYPVIYVDWNQANNYCDWAGGHLPTEAEWEKAARGTDERTYPWGNGIDRNYAWYAGWDTMPVGDNPEGKSPYGALNMAGNVWEWVSSQYKDYPYNATDGREDLSVNVFRVLRGGSWGSNISVLRSTYRYRDYQSDSSNQFGFRCANDIAPKLSVLMTKATASPRNQSLTPRTPSSAPASTPFVVAKSCSITDSWNNNTSLCSCSSTELCICKTFNKAGAPVANGTFVVTFADLLYKFANVKCSDVK